MGGIKKVLKANWACITSKSCEDVKIDANLYECPLNVL
jgi:hypothetical protein